MRDDGDEPVKPVLVGLGALLGVALLIGGLISLIALGAASVVGVGGEDGQKADEPERSLFVPPLSPTQRPTPTPPASPAETGDTTRPTEPEKPRKKKLRPRIALTANPSTVGSMQRINLTGSYPGGGDATLQVQRKEGSWQDFPTSASVRGGTFATYVLTGRTGPNRFRVVDEATGRSSNPVTVTVR